MNEQLEDILDRLTVIAEDLENIGLDAAAQVLRAVAKLIAMQREAE